MDPQTKKETDNGRVIAVKENPLRIESFHRHVSDGFQMFWKVPVGPVKQMLQKVESAASNEGKDVTSVLASSLRRSRESLAMMGGIWW